MRPLLLAAGVACFCLLPSIARAGEVQLAAGPGVYGSSWKGDTQIGENLKLGYRFGDFVSIDSIIRLGYASVDDRVVTYLSLGGTIYGRLGPVRPYARLAVVHQHEESASAVRDDAFGALFGVGDGIRHRGGFGSSLGFDVPVTRKKDLELVLGVDATGSYFPDPRGPQLYYGGALWAGLDFGL